MSEKQVMNKNEVAIVGGAGFVGSRLTARFRKGHVFSNKYDIDLSNQLDKSIYLNVEDVDSLDQLAGVSTIINLAAVHRDDVRPLNRYDDVNVQGAKNVCEAASKHGINKIIFTSSLFYHSRLIRVMPHSICVFFEEIKFTVIREHSGTPERD